MSQANQGGGGQSPTAALGLPDKIPVTAEARSQYFPEIDNDDWEPMVNAPGFKNPNNGPPERRVFNAQYNSIVNQYYQEAVDTGALDGQTVLKIFQRWKPVVEAFTRASLRNSDLDNKIGANLSPNPNGSSQAYLRALRPDALTNASFEQTPSATGQFNIFPDENAGDDTYATPTANEQAWIVIGMVEYASDGVVPYDTVQGDVNDATGVRLEKYIRHQLESADTMAVVEFTEGPLPAYPGVGIDIDVDIHTTGITTRAWPIGFEVITESNANSGGVLGT